MASVQFLNCDKKNLMIYFFLTIFLEKKYKTIRASSSVTLVLTMIVTTTMRIAIEVAMILTIAMVLRNDYDDCNQGGDDFDGNDGAVAGAAWELKLAVASLIVPFLPFDSICKQPALELPQNRQPMWQTLQRHCGQSTPGWW